MLDLQAKLKVKNLFERNRIKNKNRVKASKWKVLTINVKFLLINKGGLVQNTST